MSDRYERELALLERYAEEFEARKLEPDAASKQALYVKQIDLVKTQFPQEDGWRRHTANLYHQQAIVKYADKKTPDALKLADMAVETSDNPRHRLLRAKLNDKVGRREQALADLNYLCENFPNSKLYLDARQLKDEIESKPKGGCFIATAAYGSSLATEVIVLTRFRDEVLLRSTLGALFVKLYYRLSPPLAWFIARAAFLRAGTRSLLLKPLLRCVRRFM